MSHVVEFVFAIAEVVGGLYQLQLCAISLPHNVRSKVRGDWEVGEIGKQGG